MPEISTTRIASRPKDMLIMLSSSIAGEKEREAATEVIKEKKSDSFISRETSYPTERISEKGLNVRLCIAWFITKYFSSKVEHQHIESINSCQEKLYKSNFLNLSPELVLI